MNYIYPHVPGFKDQETSKEAAEQMISQSKIILHLVLNALKLHKGGMTADECADYLKMSVLSVRPRFSELKSFGIIFDTQERRKSISGKRAIVWALKE